MTQEKTWDFQYIGNTQSLVVPYDGYYILEAYGAQGGGKGAYTKGTIYLNKGQTIYVYVGAQPSGGSGGWNGGGSNRTSVYGGGGATDFSISNGTWDSASHLYSRILVAGGGGGYNALGGNSGGAGGSIGTKAGNGSGDDYGSGATINSGGDSSSDDCGNNIVNGYFGVGGTADWYSEYLGGGGGGWYGGGAGGGHYNNGSGGGGSSYAWTPTYATYYPNSGYKPSTNFYLKDVTSQAGIRSDHGFARITFNNVLLDGSLSRFDEKPPLLTTKVISMRVAFHQKTLYV